MKEFLNKKREREIEEDSSCDSFMFSKNKKAKKSELFFHESNNENLLDNKLDKYSSSTLQSKNDFFLFETKRNDIFKVINCVTKNKKDKNIIKEIEKCFKNNKIPLTKAKSFKKLSCMSLSSNYYKNTDSSFSSFEEYYPYQIGEIIENKYAIINHISDGTFGRVLKIQDINTKEFYAIKILLEKEEIVKWWKYEKSFINKIKENDKENKSHCIRIIEDINFVKDGKKYYGFVFELLGLSLYEYIKLNNFMGFNIVQIQQIAKQLLEGINLIHSLNIIHTDLKPENILFVNSDFDKINNFPRNIPNFKRNNIFYNNIKRNDIKIIDFGSAMFEEKNAYGIINTRQYRAPEVILECCPIKKKTDIWSIGCILYELYIGDLLFPCHNDEEHLCLIQKSCGYYPYWMVRNTEFKELHKLFEKRKDNSYKIVKEKCKNYEKIKGSLKYQNIIGKFAHPSHKLFDDFIKYLLNIDPNKRPSASEALNHDFFKCDFQNLI